jgi:hypothetical protein
MLQTLEREPQDDFNHIYDASPAPGRVPLVSAVEWSGLTESPKSLIIQIKIYLMLKLYFMVFDTSSIA